MGICILINKVVKVLHVICPLLTYSHFVTKLKAYFAGCIVG